MTPIVSYMVAFWIAHSPAPVMAMHAKNGESPDDVRARFELEADALEQVVFDPAEPAVSSRGKAYDAFFLGVIAWEETNMRADVERGDCGKPGNPLGDCDSGNASGLWQLHLGRSGAVLEPGGGFTLLRTMPPAWQAAHAGQAVTHLDVVASRTVSVRAALHFYRQAGGCGPWSTCRWANAIARGWWASHPFH